MMKNNLAAAGLVWIATVGQSVAQEAAISDAVALWLSGDDRDGLPALAADAAQGDSTAQLILGQVDRDTIPGGFSEFLLSLGRKERAELLRAEAPNGGTDNWLLALTDEERSDLGLALFWYEANLDPIDAALDLQKVNEQSLAELVLWRTVNNGRLNLVQSMPAENFGLSEAAFLEWLRAYFADANKTINMSRFLADENTQKVAGLMALKRLERVLGLGGNFSVGLNEFIEVMRGNGDELAATADLVTLNATIQKVAEVDARIEVVDRMCSICPDSDQDYQCLIQTFEIIGGYGTLLALRTPAETAISSDVYLASDRAVTSLENLVRGLGPTDMTQVRSSCLASIMTDAG
jgi:hypothetical protein